MGVERERTHALSGKVTQLWAIESECGAVARQGRRRADGMNGGEIRARRGGGASGARSPVGWRVLIGGARSLRGPSIDPAKWAAI